MAIKKAFTLIIVVLAAMNFSYKSQAQAGIYLGGSVGTSFINQTVLDIDSLMVELKENELSYKFYAGWRLSKYIGIEGGYRNLGKSQQELDNYMMNAKTYGWDLQAMGIFPVGPVDLFGKLGVFFWDSEYEFDNELRYKNGTSFMFGLGAGVRIGGRLGVRAEWEFLDMSSGNRLSMLTAGLTVNVIKMGQ